MLDSLHIKNFRCFEDLTIESLGRVNLIVGKNSTGKSTVLEALSIYAARGRTYAFDKVLSHRNEFFHNREERFKYLFFHNQLPNTIENSLIIEDAKNEDGVCIIYDKDNGKFINGFHDKNGITDHSDWKLKVIEYSYQFVTTDLLSEDYLAYLWDEVILSSEDEEIKKSLQIIIPDLANLVFIKSQNEDSTERFAIIKIKNTARGIPLKNFGEGASRLLQIFLHALQAKNGFLLIDEFENGLHYSIQEEVWEKLFKLAKELNIQIFATTHSQDAIKAFSKVALADKEVDGKLIALGRSVGKSHYGQIIAHVYDEEGLDWIVNSGMEIR